jgi:Delta14-sterol reductase
VPLLEIARSGSGIISPIREFAYMLLCTSLWHQPPPRLDRRCYKIGSLSLARAELLAAAYGARGQHMEGSPEQQDTLGGKPTSRQTLATRGNVTMTIVMLFTLPLLVYYIWFCLAFHQGQLALPSREMLDRFPLPTGASVAIVSAWLMFQGLLQIYAPGRWVEGPPLLDGGRLKYRMNGRFAWWFTWLVLAGGVGLKLSSPTILADELGALLTTANIIAYLISWYLFLLGKRSATKHERITGNAICDFWFGAVLNPRIGGFDLKLFFESRPGLIAWVVLDFALAAKQYQLHGIVTLPMILVCAFHFWYVTDYFLHEEAILTTWDIKHENFGWMLCWGNLVWVPFTYTIQAHYLIEHTHDLPWWGAVAIVLLNMAGYVIFRGSNTQKHRFRKNPEQLVWGKPAEFIRTARGALLLTSGWWGRARHMNYFGDLIMGLAWCLPCLFDSFLPYFYVAYLIILLVHRERRDHDMCALRYGKDWERYCAKVRYRIVPGVY